MIQIEELDTVVTVDGTLPTLQRSEDARAFASFPEFQVALHPNYLFNDDVNVLNRADGALLPSENTTPIIISTFPNGSPAFDRLATKNQTGFVSGGHTRTVNLTEFSYFVAFNIVRGVPGTNLFNFVIPSSGVSDIRIIISANSKFGIYDANGQYCLDPDNHPQGTTVVYGVTYSDGNGAKLYKNGQLIATNPADIVTSSANRNMRFLYAAQSWGAESFTQALTSAEYFTGIDLSKPEHTAKRAAVTNYMIQEYIN